MTDDAARRCVLFYFGGVGESYVTVVGAEIDSSGFSRVTDDTARAVGGNDVACVVAVLYNDSTGSVVSVDTACGVAVLGAVGVDDLALVDAVLEESIGAVAAAGDAADGARGCL